MFVFIYFWSNFLKNWVGFRFFLFLPLWAGNVSELWTEVWAPNGLIQNVTSVRPHYRISHYLINGPQTQKTHLTTQKDTGREGERVHEQDSELQQWAITPVVACWCEIKPSRKEVVGEKRGYESSTHFSLFQYWLCILISSNSLLSFSFCSWAVLWTWDFSWY